MEKKTEKLNEKIDEEIIKTERAIAAKSPADIRKEFLISELQAVGADTGNINTYKEAIEAVKKQKFSDRRAIIKGYKAYDKEQKKVDREIKKGIYSSAIKIPEKVLEIIGKGAGAGMSVAAIINTIAPNLFPAALGFAAGTIDVNVLVKLGLVTLGAFSTPVIAQGAVLGVGAVAGVATYATGKAIVGIAKGIGNKIKENKEER